jgi:outer membrane protein assembly factor BamB
LAIFAADNPGGGYLAALDTETGRIAWRVARGNDSSYSSPRVANVGGRDQLLISGCGAVTSFDPATGDRLWSTPCIAESTCGTIVTTSDRIFASGGYPQQETICLSADGEKLWSNDTKVYEPSMLVVGQRLVAVKDDGIAFCWSTESGDVIWKKRLGGNFSGSPILVGDHVYVANLRGETFVFRAGDQYEPIAKNRLGDDCYASPAVSNGELFLRIGLGSGGARKEQVVCIGPTD